MPKDYSAQTNENRLWLMGRCRTVIHGSWECWEWQARKRRGYGTIVTRNTGGIKQQSAHRVAYEVFVGPIPQGLLVLHKCDNPACIRPSHLFLGSHMDNSQDALKKKRLKIPKTKNHGTRNGRAKLTESQVLAILLLKGEKSQKSLARQFGVCKSTIQLIHSGNRWKTLHSERQGGQHPSLA